MENFRMHMGVFHFFATQSVKISKLINQRIIYTSFN